MPNTILAAELAEVMRLRAADERSASAWVQAQDYPKELLSDRGCTVDAFDKKRGKYIAALHNFLRTHGPALMAMVERAATAQAGQGEAVAWRIEWIASATSEPMQELVFYREQCEHVVKMLAGAIPPMHAAVTPLYTSPPAPSAGAVEDWRPDARIIDLAERLVAAGPKAAHVSASECHEISEFILSLAAAPEASRG